MRPIIRALARVAAVWVMAAPDIAAGQQPPRPTAIVNVKEEDAADHHTPDFYVDDSGLDLGVKALTAMTLHYMRTRPAIVARSWHRSHIGPE